jgi:hypothetical protein
LSASEALTDGRCGGCAAMRSRHFKKAEPSNARPHRYEKAARK